MITIHNPICSDNGDLELALKDSFLPGTSRKFQFTFFGDLLDLFSIIWALMYQNCAAVPSLDKFPEMADGKVPGEIIFEGGNIVLNHGRKAIILRIVNTGDRPVQVFIVNFTFILYLLRLLVHFGHIVEAMQLISTFLQSAIIVFICNNHFRILRHTFYSCSCLKYIM